MSARSKSFVKGYVIYVIYNCITKGNCILLTTTSEIIPNLSHNVPTWWFETSFSVRSRVRGNLESGPSRLFFSPWQLWKKSWTKKKLKQKKYLPTTPMLNNTGQQNLLLIIGDIRAKSPQNAAKVPIRTSIYLRVSFTRAQWIHYCWQWGVIKLPSKLTEVGTLRMCIAS